MLTIGCLPVCCFLAGIFPVALYSLVQTLRLIVDNKLIKQLVYRVATDFSFVKVSRQYGSTIV